MHDTHVHEDDYLSLYRGKNTKEPWCPRLNPLYNVEKAY